MYRDAKVYNYNNYYIIHVYDNWILRSLHINVNIIIHIQLMLKDD